MAYVPGQSDIYILCGTRVRNLVVLETPGQGTRYSPDYMFYVPIYFEVYDVISWYGPADKNSPNLSKHASPGNLTLLTPTSTSLVRLSLRLHTGVEWELVGVRGVRR